MTKVSVIRTVNVISRKDYEYTIPETLLECGITLPEKTFKFPVDSKHPFSSRKSAREFIRYHETRGAKFELLI